MKYTIVIAIMLQSFMPLIAQRSKGGGAGAAQTAFELAKFLYEKGYFENYYFWGKHTRVFSLEKNGEVHWFKGKQQNLFFIPVYVENLRNTTFEDAKFEMMTPTEKSEYNARTALARKILLNSNLDDLSVSPFVVPDLRAKTPLIVMTEWDLPFWDAYGGKLLLIVIAILLYAKYKELKTNNTK